MLEALLFAAAGPLGAEDLAFRLPVGADIRSGLDALGGRYRDRGVRLVEVGGRWRFETAPDLAFLMTVEREAPRRLSRAAQETLAIIAYHQPVTRAEIEAIRGVQTSRGALDVLLELGMIRMKGRRRTPGRPVIWATTAGFLEHYGLAALSDLPGAREMVGVRVGATGPAATAEDEPVHERDEDVSETPVFQADFLSDDTRE